MLLSRTGAENAVFNTDPALYTVEAGGEGVTVSTAGWYCVSVNIHQNSTVQRPSAMIRILVGPLPHVVSQHAVGPTGASGYIRNSAGHTQSSTHLCEVLVHAEAGETIGIAGFQEAAAGTVNCDAGKSSMTVSTA